MVGRPEIVAVADEMIEWGRVLIARTNRLLRDDTITQPAALIGFLGVRTQNSVRAIRVLAPHAIDDQIAILGRHIVELAMDIEYLSVETRRGTRVLTVDDKIDLFNSFYADVIDRMEDFSFLRGVAATLTTADQEGFARLKARRRALGVRATAGFWHGARQYDVYQELRAAYTALNVPEALTMLQTINDAYQYLSFQTHTSPAYASAVEPGQGREPPQLVEANTLDAYLVMGVSSAAQVFMRWGMQVVADHGLASKSRHGRRFRFPFLRV
jgi:hypothetical protein